MTKIAAPPTVLRSIPGPTSCELCEKPGLKTELIRDPFIYGVGSDAVELCADVPVHTCDHCSHSYTGEEAEIVRHEAVCQHLGVLTPAEIHALRKNHDLSRAAFARLTGFGEATLARWERREVIQNASSDRYLRLLKDPVNFRRLSSFSERPTESNEEESAENRTCVHFEALSGKNQQLFRRAGNEFRPQRRAA